MEQLTKNQAVATSQEAVQNQNEPQLRDENAHNDKSVHNLFLSLILHLGNLFLIVQLHFSKLFLILKSGVNHTSRGSISTSTLPSIKLRKCSSKIITSILSFISGRLATKSNQIKQLIRNGRSASL